MSLFLNTEWCVYVLHLFSLLYLGNEYIYIYIFLYTKFSPLCPIYSLTPLNSYQNCVCVFVCKEALKMHIFYKRKEETERGEKKNTASVCVVS